MQENFCAARRRLSVFLISLEAKAVNVARFRDILKDWIEENLYPSNLTPTPHLGRDRFKLQHEFLSHKWLTLKLRREDRIEESEAKFQLAKTLEAQLDDSAKPSVSGAKPVDDVGVEDFLDPQLLFALKEIGFEDDSTAKGLEKPEPIKSVGDKGENSSRERIRLEAQIKAEKVKAINLKRAGK
ncbi:hypothetical protein LOK49_LG09G01722 [Camellia lanceoleosa]|uniref:Uncharacterized protein n=1 Tax=Camellia lanceoleosa TaxID=1840588 RepID=A0ACC0GGP9_9ERIC|nr:hypothetical protein LOK49_LG09G01722 [Camellia lanceoleosa]